MIVLPGRIPIHIYPVFWLLIIMLGWMNSNSIAGTAIWAVVILVSVVIHEFGHALTALFFGQNAEIDLVAFGGLTRRDGRKLAKWKEFLIVLNGPLAGFVLAGLCYTIFQSLQTANPLVSYALKIAFEVNIFWTILNLLPILPLDGGQLMRIVFEALFGFKGTKIAFLLSLISASAFGLYFFVIGQVLLGALLFMMAFESYRLWSELKGSTVQDSDTNLQNYFQTAFREYQRGDFSSALEKFASIRSQAPKGSLYVNASQFGAQILSDQGDYKTAYEWLYPLKNRLAPEFLRLFQHLAYQLQEWEEVAAISQKVYQASPTAETALINALTFGILAKPEPAVGWMHCSIQNGLLKPRDWLSKREFDGIRNDPSFQSLLKSCA